MTAWSGTAFDDWLAGDWDARLLALEGEIARHSDQAEAQQRLPDATVTALQQAGVTNLFLPRSLGGLEVDPLTCALITERIARVDAAAAWFVMVANAPRLMACTWPDALVERLWGDDPNCLVAASGHTPLAGTPQGADTIRLSGRIGFASGCHNAHWLAAPCQIDAGDGTAERRMVLINAAQVVIEDDWQVLGMRGTGSNSVDVSGVTVQRAMTAPIAARLQRANRYYTGTLYRCPGRVLFATYVPISLAVAERALAALDGLAREKVPAASGALLRERQLAQLKFGKALANYRAARVYFLDALQEAWERARRGEEATDTQRADLYLAGTHGVQAAADSVRLVADAAGTSVIYERGELARLLRDMEVLRHHGFASENRYASVAQQYWGSDLDYPMLLR